LNCTFFPTFTIQSRKKKRGFFFLFFGKGGGKTKEIKIIEKKIRTTKEKVKKDKNKRFKKAHNDERTRVKV
jgi:hypothetical protein